MISITRADGKAEFELLNRFRKRSEQTGSDVTQVVSRVVGDVRERGDVALREYTEKFDGKAPENFEVSKSEISSALDKADADFVKALKKAAENIKDFHMRQKQESRFNTSDKGVILGQRVRALKRVGIYVPGGTAAYPSSVLMNAIPAKIAGVEEIVMVTPPG
ncbi:MAG TPA: histidinol dehydrogenase, partial [Oscillospiraceae bacterium]|nr:histidinol dehydrogenase [Oscillospiraceae bacterium]